MTFINMPEQGEAGTATHGPAVPWDRISPSSRKRRDSRGDPASKPSLMQLSGFLIGSGQRSFGVTVFRRDALTSEVFST